MNDGTQSIRGIEIDINKNSRSSNIIDMKNNPRLSTVINSDDKGIYLSAILISFCTYAVVAGPYEHKFL
jgi:hypothetical protein